MRDLDLWLALSDEDVGPVQTSNLLSLLEELSRLRLHCRTPFFARLLPLTRHSDAEIRSAAIRVLAGCTGARARREVVAALDDDNRLVREAALHAISVAPCRSLHAHALFQARSDVRLDAVTLTMHSVGPNRLAGNDADLPLYLLSDSQCRAVVEENLAAAHVDRLPLGLLIEMHAAGEIDDSLARRLVLKSEPEGLLSVIRESLVDDHPDDRAVRWMMSLFWDEGKINDADASSSRFPDGVMSFLRESLKARRSVWINHRFVMICKDLASQKGHWNGLAARLCLLGMANEAQWIFESVLPADVFRASLEVFYESGMSCDEVAETTVVQLLQLPICRRLSGQLDLWSIGAILHLRRRDGFQRLLEIYSTNQIAAGFDEDPEESVKLFSYPGSAKERNQLIESVFARRRKDPLAVAVMMCALPADALDFASRLTPHETVKTLRALYDLAGRHGWSVSTNKSNSIAHHLTKQFVVGATLRGDAFAIFLSEWLTNLWSSEAPIDQVFIDRSDAAVQRNASFTIGVDVLTDVVRKLDNGVFVDWMRENLSAAVIAQLLSMLPSCSGLSYAFEVTLAQKLADHPDPAIAGWSADRVAIQQSGMGREAAFAKLDESSRMKPISSQLSGELRSGAPHRLESIVKPLMSHRRVGVASALAGRAEPISDDERIWACIALLTSGDPIDDVASGVNRFGGNDGIINAAASQLSSVSDLSKLGTCGLVVMYRWEAAAFEFGDRCMKDATECEAWLRIADELSAPILGRDLVECLAHVLALYIAREKGRAEELLTESHLARWLELLPTRHSNRAAGVLMRAFNAKLNRSAFVALRDQFTVLQTVGLLDTR